MIFNGNHYFRLRLIEQLLAVGMPVATLYGRKNKTYLREIVSRVEVFFKT